MSKKVFGVGGVLLGLLFGSAGNPAISAKPPYLPVPVEQEFEPVYPPENVWPVDLQTLQCLPGFRNGEESRCSPDYSGLVIGLGEYVRNANSGPVSARSVNHPHCPGTEYFLQQFWDDIVQTFHGECPFYFSWNQPFRIINPALPAVYPCWPVPAGVYDGLNLLGRRVPLHFDSQPGDPGCPVGVGHPGCPVNMAVPPAVEMGAGILGESIESMQRQAEARRMYELAEFYLKTGNILAAYHFFQETHLHNPISRYGQVAQHKLAQIEAQVINARLGVHQGDRVPGEGDWRFPHPMRNWPAGYKRMPAARVNHDFEPSHVVTPERVPTESERYLQKLAQAQEMFHIGERCRTSGDLDKAYTCYHEAKRLCPDSDYAQLAGEHIRRIDVLRQIQDAQEEAEAPEIDIPEEADEQSQFDLHQLTPMFLPFLPELFGVWYVPPQEGCATHQGTSPTSAWEGEVSECPCFPKAKCCGKKIPKNPGQQCLDDAEECHEASLGGSAALNLWLIQTLRSLGGNAHIELDVDATGNDGLRIQGGIYFGPIGCQVIGEGDSYRVVCPAVRGWR